MQSGTSSLQSDRSSLQHGRSSVQSGRKVSTLRHPLTHIFCLICFIISVALLKKKIINFFSDL